MRPHLNTPTVSLIIPRSIDLALGSHLRRFELNAEREQERAIAASLRSRSGLLLPVWKPKLLPELIPPIMFRYHWPNDRKV